jgi:NAD-dependent dihydropyrimidine dehydrogenase PreA subunit
MIISLRSLGYEDLKKKLVQKDKIVLFSCNSCVKYCGIGGNKIMDKLGNMLEADGYDVIGKDLVSIGCTINLVQKHKEDLKKTEMYEAATVIIPLICEDGFENVEHVFQGKKIIPIAKTVGTGAFNIEKGLVLTTPIESTGLSENPEGYSLPEVAERLELFDGFFDENDANEQKKEYVNLTINGQEITVPKNQNLLSICKENDIDVPHLCYHDELSDYGACRLCLVKIKGVRDFAASCCVKAEDGMEIVTSDEELETCRRVILELIMASGQHNCLTCSKGIPNPMSSCELQGLIRKAGIDKSRFEQNREGLKEDDSSPAIYFDPNKCILCGRCVRACEEIAGLSNLGFINRGDKTIVAAGLNTEISQSACAECLACIDVCPTGALNEKVVYFSGEGWISKKKYKVI